MEYPKGGRPRIESAQEEPLDNYTSRVPYRLARVIRRVGDGNFSAGVRRLAERAAQDFEFMKGFPEKIDTK